MALLLDSRLLDLVDSSRILDFRERIKMKNETGIHKDTFISLSINFLLNCLKGFWGFGVLGLRLGLGTRDEGWGLRDEG